MSDLQGKRVVVTRPREDFHTIASLLEAQGAIPIPFPTIEIRPAADIDFVKSTLNQLHRFDWLILTSANAAKMLAELFGSGPLPSGLKLAAVGPKTANAILQLGWGVDFIPEKYVAEAILPGLGKLEGQRVLLARGNLALPNLHEGIRALGGEVTDLVIYHTLPVSPVEKGLRRIRNGVDVLTFTSSSTLHNFVALMQSARMDPNNLPGSPIYAHIGPVTAATAKYYELPTDVVAEIHTVEGMVDSLCRFYAEKKVKTQ
jgi:uroporphyrinogen-III synthase